MIKHKLLIYLTLLFFTSCNDAKKEPETSEYDIRSHKQERLDSLNENQAQNLSNQLDAIRNNDSAIKFTYQIQELEKRNNKPISVIGYIKDITLNDSNYILKIKGSFGRRKYFGEILITPEQFHEINKQLYHKSSHNKGCFIFTPTAIESSSLLTISSDVATDDDAETVDEAK